MNYTFFKFCFIPGSLTLRAEALRYTKIEGTRLAGQEASKLSTNCSKYIEKQSTLLFELVNSNKCESLTLLSMTSALNYITIVNLVCRGDGRPVVRTVYLGTHRSYSLSGHSKNHDQNVRDRRKGYAYHCICRAHC